MFKLVQFLLYRLIQLVLLPLAVVGYVIFVVKLVVYSRRTGASATVLASLYTRYMQHMLGTRRDQPAVRLMLAMPSVSRVGLLLTTAPTIVAHLLTRYVPKLYRYPYSGQPPMIHQSVARTTYYDEALAQQLPNIEQFVMLGAGFDTRAYRLPANTHVRCFEIDEPQTQAFKREMLKQAAIDISISRVTFVPADFEQEDWFEKLLAAGFDSGKRSLFTWESVTMYLDRRAVEQTLQTIARTAPGTVVAFDYFSNEIIESRSLFMQYARAVIKITGEPWSFGIDNTPPVRRHVADFLESCGLELKEQHNFGEETDTERAPAGFAIAVVPPANMIKSS